MIHRRHKLVIYSIKGELMTPSVGNKIYCGQPRHFKWRGATQFTLPLQRNQRTLYKQCRFLDGDSYRLHERDKPQEINLPRHFEVSFVEPRPPCLLLCGLKTTPRVFAQI